MKKLGAIFLGLMLLASCASAGSSKSGNGALTTQQVTKDRGGSQDFSAQDDPVARRERQKKINPGL